jgi:hypothetical protein
MASSVVDFALNGNANKPKDSRYGERIPLDPDAMYTMDVIDQDGDRVDDRYQTGPGQPRINTYEDPTITEGNSNTANPEMANNNDRLAGGNFGLSPTEVVETSRGRGYGLTYSPQQQGSKTTKFGGRSIGNIVNFNPFLSQTQNPSINVNASPTTVAESGPGGVSGVTGSTGPLVETGTGNLVSETGPGDLLTEEGPGDLNSTIPTPSPTPPPTTTPTPPPTTTTPTPPPTTTPTPPPTTTPTPPPTTTPTPPTNTRQGAGIRLNNVTLKALDTGVNKFDSSSDAKNILAAMNRQTASRGKKDASKISDKKIEKLISNAGIQNFDSKKDAKTFTNFLIERAKEQRDDRKAARNVIKDAKQKPKEEGEKSIMKQVKAAIKEQTGEKPTKNEVRNIVRRADVGKKLTVKDLGKIKKAAKKAKKRKNKKNK